MQLNKTGDCPHLFYLTFLVFQGSRDDLYFPHKTVILTKLPNNFGCPDFF